MGSGKSTIGRRLAECLQLRFIDTDTFIETRFRQRVVDMFAREGEEVFRRRERVVMQELMSMGDTVFATGGGLPCHLNYDGASMPGRRDGLLSFLSRSLSSMAGALQAHMSDHTR